MFVSKRMGGDTLDGFPSPITEWSATSGDYPVEEKRNKASKCPKRTIRSLPTRSADVIRYSDTRSKQNQTPDANTQLQRATTVNNFIGNPSGRSAANA